jgi:hypothetical protein
VKKTIWTLATAGLLVAGSGGYARANLVLSGPDANAGSYTTAQLSTLAGGTTVGSGGLSGISLWNLLGGGITTSTPAGDNAKNAILRYYLVGTSATGQTSVVSLGEIDPSFGGTAPIPAFVAFQTTGSALLTAPDLVVPGAPGRDLTNLTSLQLLAVPALPAVSPPPGTSSIPSTSVQLSGTVQNPGSYALAQLQSLTSAQLTVGTDTYTGVPLWSFLSPTDSDIASQIVITQATDGYEVVLSLAELDPDAPFNGNPDDLLPYADTGTDFLTDGVARTIFPTDNKHGRWESNLDAVIVADVPEPGSLLLLAFGLGSVAVARRRLARYGKTEASAHPA